MLDTDRLMKYARLYSARKKLKTKYESLGKEIEAMEEGLIGHMSENQMDKCNLKGGYVIYLDTKIWPKLKTSRDKVIEALKANGHGDIVNETYNTNSLASWLRELAAMDESIPEGLQNFIESNPVTSLLVKKSK